MVGEMETKEKPKPTPDYLMQLMNDKKLMSSLPNFCGIFNHLERLLDEEISRVRKDMYNDTLNGSTEKRSAELPDAVGPIVQLQEKLYVPVKEYPDFNFVGRILGPRGLTAKQLEAETGCKIMVRGKGSMRDKKKEEQNRGKPNWEHLNEDLHVLITVEDAQNRAEIKLKRAVEEVKKLLVPAVTWWSPAPGDSLPLLQRHWICFVLSPQNSQASSNLQASCFMLGIKAEGEDSLKKMQLMELAILNGTYRDANIKSPLAFSLAATAQAPRIITGPAPVLPPAALRTPTPAGPTIMPLIRQIQTAVMPNGTPHPTAAIVPPGPEAGLIYTPYEYPYTLAPATSILEYPIEPSGVLGAVATKVRRHDMRVHPYQRIVTADRGYFYLLNPILPVQQENCLDLHTYIVSRIY
ncbi:KH domain-containing RNA-binding protein QKI isoform 2-T2 [Sarcophilus harrisii]